MEKRAYLRARRYYLSSRRTERGLKNFRKESSPTSTTMAKFYGLRGTKLNITIGFIAGLDFLYGSILECVSVGFSFLRKSVGLTVAVVLNSLFGYDQGVTGGLLKLPSFEKQFPDINEYQWVCSDGVSFNCPNDNPNANEKLFQQYANYQGR